MGGQTVPMSFWNRPLHAMTDAFTAAGFRISVISEPHPVPEARELFPDELAAMPSFLCFLFFVLQAGELPRGGARRFLYHPGDNQPFRAGSAGRW